MKYWPYIVCWLVLLLIVQRYYLSNKITTATSTLQAELQGQEQLMNKYNVVKREQCDSKAKEVAEAEKVFQDLVKLKDWICWSIDNPQIGEIE